MVMRTLMREPIVRGDGVRTSRFTVMPAPLSAMRFAGSMNWA